MNTKPMPGIERAALAWTQSNHVNKPTEISVEGESAETVVYQFIHQVWGLTALPPVTCVVENFATWRDRTSLFLRTGCFAGVVLDDKIDV
jgi:hypothetical protein